MADKKSKFQEFIQDAQRHRVFEQESLALEATEVIATLLKEQNLNRADLAKRIGKSKAYVTQLMSGSRNMTLHTFADLAFVLGCRVELKPSMLEKSPEVIVYRNEIHMGNPLRRKAVQEWGRGTGVSLPAVGDLCFVGDAAHAA